MKKKLDDDRKPSKFSEYEILTKLGSGSFGVVYKVKHKPSNSILVMKQINIAPMNRSQREEALNEAKILQSLKSPYIVGYHDSFIEHEKLCIVMEYCENGDLAQLLKARHGRLMEEDIIWKYFIEVSLALLYLHNKKILHRDMKTMNVFLTKDFHVRLGDLGVAKVLSQNTNFAHTMVGTPYYLSPELCQEKPYNEKSDVWSLGCVLYEMCALKHPFESRNQAALIMKIIQGKYDPLSNVYSKELIEIVTQCLQKDYRRRPTVYDVLSFPSVQLKAKALRIDLPDKSTLYTRVEAKRSVPEAPKKPVAVPVVKPKPTPAPQKPLEPIKEKKEPKKPDKKVALVKEEKKEFTPPPEPKLEKKPSQPSVANLNNNEFRKLLKDREKPPEPIPVSEKKEKKSSKPQPAIITAPNFHQAKPAVEPSPVKEVVQKVHVIATPALQQSRGKPKRVRNGAPVGLARKVHQVIQPAPILKKGTPKHKVKDVNEYKDEDIRAVENLPDFVGDPVKKEEEEEPYQIKKPTIEDLLAKGTGNATKKSEVQDPDAFMRNIMGEDYSLVIKDDPAVLSPPTADIVEDQGLDSIVKGIAAESADPIIDADVVEKPLLVSVGYQIGVDKIEEAPAIDETEEISSENPASGISDNSVSEQSLENNPDACEEEKILQANEENEVEEIKDDTPDAESPTSTSEENITEMLRIKQQQYEEKLAEFEKHKLQLSARILLTSIEKCCDLVKDNRDMVLYENLKLK